MTPLEFLTRLWQFKPDDQYVLIWTGQDKRSRWFREIPAAAEYAAAASADKDVYVGLGLAGKDYGPFHRCPSEEVTGISGFGSDFDLLSEAHSSKTLPRTIEEALTIIPPGLPSNLDILTGNGAHGWWLFKEPYIFEGEEDRKRVQRALARFHTLLRAHAAAHGWSYDRLADLARILRIPGTRNLKDPKRPKDVRCLRQSDVRYTLSDIEEMLDHAGIPDPEAQEAAAREWSTRFADTPIVVNLNARIPQEMIDGFCANDPRFRNTWECRRHDLKDPSTSGYDMALAHFGVAAKLPAQTIVDLIVHHRAIHNQRQRTTVDYFQRTISKALAQVEADTPPPAPPGNPAPPSKAATSAPQGAPVAPEGGQATNGARPMAANDPVAKVLLCEYISKVLGIPLIRLDMYEGDEPTFHMSLDGENEPVVFPTAEKFLCQAAMKMAIVKRTKRVMNRVKPKAWSNLEQTLLDACFVHQGDIGESLAGKSRKYVGDYLDDTHFIESIAAAKVAERKRPIMLNGNVAITTDDLKRYINKSDFERYTIPGVATMLRSLKCKQKRHTGRGFKEQSRWLIPVEEFDPADYSDERKETPESE